MQITNGSITFERTRKTADYEGKKASVTLSFNVADGEDYENVCASVGAAAASRALIMVGETQEAHATETPATRTRAPRTPPPQPNAATVVANGLEGAQADPFVGGVLVSNALVSAPDSGTVLSMVPLTPVAGITDDTLQTAIKTKVAADAKHTAGVMALVQEFTGNPLAKIYSIPLADQTKRAEFLTRLASL